ncbi:hypothetical protein DJ010_09460 [Nocardioides silvaticus]|uniref:UspA domain-containing protein n=1 Tax=Nocardioides silvaticus TaxID=2201891 RepID=A0A316TV33_9ACTN|nr:universal stress protein [Nocardioides silvaticus]PWN03326.1 hypothetical protein DJ010_09460 [Nocardioides silvaticus]
MDKIPSGSIVVAVDGSRDADRAVHWAAEQAAVERRNLVVMAVATQAPALVAAGPGIGYVHQGHNLLANAKTLAQEAADLAARHRPGVAVETVADLGNPRPVLADTTMLAHLLVMGSRGRGPMSSKLLGSVSASVARSASCPVVICRPGTELRVKKGVLVGADGTAESLPVIDFAFRQASLRSQPLTVVHTVRDLSAIVGASSSAPADDPRLVADRLLLAESMAGFRERYPEVHASSQVLRGSADSALTAIADRYDLVVIGRHPIDSVGRHLSGAIATAVLERSHTHVAVVPEAVPAAGTH